MLKLLKIIYQRIKNNYLKLNIFPVTKIDRLTNDKLFPKSNDYVQDITIEFDSAKFSCKYARTRTSFQIVLRRSLAQSELSIGGIDQSQVRIWVALTNQGRVWASLEQWWTSVTIMRIRLARDCRSTSTLK